MEGSWLALNASQAGIHCGEGKELPPPPQRSPGTISTRLSYNWAGGAVGSFKELYGSKMRRPLLGSGLMRNENAIRHRSGGILHLLSDE